MKRWLAFLLLFPLCLTACAPSAEDYLLFTPAPAEGTASAKASESPTPTPTPAETPGDNVLRVLVNDRDMERTHSFMTLVDEVERYRKREGLDPVKLEFTPVQFNNGGNEYYDYAAAAAHFLDTVTLKLLAGDDDFDMFLVSHNTYPHARAQFNGMLRKEYFASMGDLGLAALFDGMLPGVKELCEADGDILLAPLGFRFHGWLLRMEPARRLHINPAVIPGTAVAFTDYLLGIRDELESEQIAYDNGWGISHHIGMYEEQYVNEYMTHGAHTQELWDALVYAVDGLCQSGLLDSEIGEWVSESNIVPYEFPVIYYTDVLIHEYANLIDGSAGHDYGHEQDDTALMPYLRLTEDARIPIESGFFLAVNKGSQNQAPAADYLSTLLSRAFHDYYKDTITYDNHWNIYDSPTLAGSPSNRWYRASLANSSRSQVDAYGYYAVRYIHFADYMRYHNGEITSAEWKAKVDRQLEFLRDE